MDHAEKAGIGVSVFGHIALLGLLSIAVSNAVAPLPPPAMEVSYVDEVGLASASPNPAPAAAPRAAEQGPLERAAPAPELEPAPPAPAPLPLPTPAPRQAASPPARPAPAQRPARRPGNTGTGEVDRTPGRLNLNPGSFGNDAPSRSSGAPAAVMSAQASASIAQAIVRQIQPCANRQVYPGPGAERIVTPIILRLNRDGSLVGRPRIGRQRGIDAENGRYAERVADLAVNAFVSCSPLRGLPQELYDVPRGWSNFTMNYRLPG